MYGLCSVAAPFSTDESDGTPTGVDEPAFVEVFVAELVLKRSRFIGRCNDEAFADGKNKLGGAQDGN